MLKICLLWRDNSFVQVPETWLSGYGHFFFLVEDPDLVVSTHLQQSVTTVLGDPVFFFFKPLYTRAHTWCTDMHSVSLFCLSAHMHAHTKYLKSGGIWNVRSRTCTVKWGRNIKIPWDNLISFKNRFQIFLGNSKWNSMFWKVWYQLLKISAVSYVKWDF